MNEIKTVKIKSIVTKIDTNKIVSYPQHPESKTLRRIVNYSKRVLDSGNEKEIFRLSTSLAYYLDAIINKTDYVKKEEEKKYWLEISRELFENTIGIKDKK